MAIKSDNFGKRKKVAREYNPSFVVEVIGGVPRKAPAGITKDAPGTGGYVTKCKVLNPLGNPDVKAGQEVEVVMYPDKTTFDAFVEVDKAKSDIFATAGLEKTETGYASRYPSGAGQGNDRIFIDGVAARAPHVNITLPEGSFNIRSDGTGYNFSSKSEMTSDEVKHVLGEAKRVLVEGLLDSTKDTYRIYSHGTNYLPKRAVALPDDFSPESLLPILDKYGAATVRLYDADAEKHDASNAVSVYYRKDRDSGDVIGGLTDEQQVVVDAMGDIKGDIIPTISVSFQRDKKYPTTSQLYGTIEHILKVAEKQEREPAAFVGGVACLRVTNPTDDHADAETFIQCSAARLGGFAERNYAEFTGVASVLQLESSVLKPDYALAGDRKAEVNREDDNVASTPHADSVDTETFDSDIPLA